MGECEGVSDAHIGSSMIVAAQVLCLATYLSLMAALAIMDVRRGVLPNALSLSVGAIGVLWRGFALGNFADAVTGAIAGGGTLAVVAYGYRQWRKRDGLGGGDVKMTAAMGMFLGPVGVFQALAIASMSGVLWVGGTMLIGRRRVTATTNLKFGPFLALGGAIVGLGSWHAC